MRQEGKGWYKEKMVWVRALSQDEIEAAARIARQEYVRHNLVYLSDLEEAELRRGAELDCDPEEMRQEVKSGQGVVVGGFIEGEMVGSGSASLGRGEAVTVHRLYLKVTGQGVGGEIMGQLEEWARLQSVNQVELEVFKPNTRVRRWVERQGFEKSGKRQSRLYEQVTIVRYGKRLA